MRQAGGFLKKILWLFFAIFVLSCIVPEGNNVYAKSGTSLVASSATTEKDKAAINIDLKDNSGIWALKFKVSYDHTKLKLNSTQNGKVFSSGDITLPESLDKDDFVFLASSNSLKDIEKNGTVITLHFKAKSYATEGKYPIKLTLIQAIDVDGKNVDIDTEDGSVTVSYETGNNDLVFDKAASQELKIPSKSVKKVKKVKVNDEEIDNKNYTVDSDGNVVISAEYLNTLDNGKYKITIEGNKNKTKTDIFVKKDLQKELDAKTAEKEKSREIIDGTKKTNQSKPTKGGTVIAVVVIVLVVVAGICYVLMKRRRTKE